MKVFYTDPLDHMLVALLSDCPVDWLLYGSTTTR